MPADIEDNVLQGRGSQHQRSYRVSCKCAREAPHALSLSRWCLDLFEKHMRSYAIGFCACVVIFFRFLSSVFWRLCVFVCGACAPWVWFFCVAGACALDCECMCTHGNDCKHCLWGRLTCLLLFKCTYGAIVLWTPCLRCMRTFVWCMFTPWFVSWAVCLWCMCTCVWCVCTHDVIV